MSLLTLRLRRSTIIILRPLAVATRVVPLVAVSILFLIVGVADARPSQAGVVFALLSAASAMGAGAFVLRSAVLVSTGRVRAGLGRQWFDVNDERQIHVTPTGVGRWPRLVVTMGALHAPLVTTFGPIVLARQAHIEHVYERARDEVVRELTKGS